MLSRLAGRGKFRDDRASLAPLIRRRALYWLPPKRARLPRAFSLLCRLLQICCFGCAFLRNLEARYFSFGRACANIVVRDHVVNCGDVPLSFFSRGTVQLRQKRKTLLNRSDTRENPFFTHNVGLQFWTTTQPWMLWTPTGSNATFCRGQ